MADKEIQIGGKTYSEKSKITMNVYTFIAILSFFLTLGAWAYNNVVSKIKSTNSTVNDIQEKQNEQSVNIGIILDRTSGMRTNSNTTTTDKPFENNAPTN